MSRLTVNDVLERVWDDSGDEDDFSGSEEGENDDYVSHRISYHIRISTTLNIIIK